MKKQAEKSETTKFLDSVEEMLKNKSKNTKSDTTLKLTSADIITTDDSAAQDNLPATTEDTETENAKNALWESNHVAITAAIANLIQEYKRMPLKNEIAKTTGLSRNTITRHLKDYRHEQHFAEHSERFQFMGTQILSRVMIEAIQGDMRAAKIFLDATGQNGKGNNTTVNTQNNYIQINKTILSQEAVQQLTPEQLARIEEIVSGKDKI